LNARWVPSSASKKKLYLDCLYPIIRKYSHPVIIITTRLRVWKHVWMQLSKRARETFTLKTPFYLYNSVSYLKNLNLENLYHKEFCQNEKNCGTNTLK